MTLATLAFYAFIGAGIVTVLWLALAVDNGIPPGGE